MRKNNSIIMVSCRNYHTNTYISIHASRLKTRFYHGIMLKNGTFTFLFKQIMAHVPKKQNTIMVFLGFQNHICTQYVILFQSTLNKHMIAFIINQSIIQTLMGFKGV